METFQIVKKWGHYTYNQKSSSFRAYAESKTRRQCTRYNTYLVASRFSPSLGLVFGSEFLTSEVFEVSVGSVGSFRSFEMLTFLLEMSSFLQFGRAEGRTISQSQDLHQIPRSSTIQTPRDTEITRRLA